MRRDVLWTAAVLGGTAASALLVSLAGAARAPDVTKPLALPPPTATEAEGMGLFAHVVDTANDGEEQDGVVAKYAANRAELGSSWTALFSVHWCCIRRVARAITALTFIALLGFDAVLLRVYWLSAQIRTDARLSCCSFFFFCLAAFLGERTCRSVSCFRAAHGGSTGGQGLRLPTPDVPLLVHGG